MHLPKYRVAVAHPQPDTPLQKTGQIEADLQKQKILENVVRCKYFEAGVHIKNSIKNSYKDGLCRTTQTLDHVVVVHDRLIWDKKKSETNEYNDMIAIVEPIYY